MLNIFKYNADNKSYFFPVIKNTDQYFFDCYNDF